MSIEPRTHRLNRRQLLAASALSPLLPRAPTGIAQSGFPGNGDPPLLVDAAWLKAALSLDNLTVFDLQPLRAYRQGHIPGAVHAWWQDTMELNNPVYGTVLMEVDNQQQRIDFLNSLGIGPDTTVVAYDGDQGQWAARLVWFLRFLGHRSASMLDGGLNAWNASGGELASQENPADERTDATVEPQPDFYVVTPQLLDRLEDPAARLIDCRSAEERSDSVHDTLPIGQIPDSIWLPWTSALQDGSGALQDPATLAQQIASAGIVQEHRLYLYNRFGVESAHSWLVFKLLGFPHVTIYDRGWAGWSSQPDLPIAPIDSASLSRSTAVG